MCLFWTSRGWSNAKLYVTTSQPPLWVWPQLTKVISQSLMNTHACTTTPPVHCMNVCVCVCWSSTVWPDMHLNRSRGWGGPGVRNAKSYFPKPTRPHPAHARTGTHTHTHSHSHTVQTHMTTVTNRLSFQCVNSHLFPDNNNSYRSGG